MAIEMAKDVLNETSKRQQSCYVPFGLRVMSAAGMDLNAMFLGTETTLFFFRIFYMSLLIDVNFH